MIGTIRNNRSFRLGRALIADIEGLAAIEMALILPRRGLERSDRAWLASRRQRRNGRAL